MRPFAVSVASRERSNLAILKRAPALQGYHASGIPGSRPVRPSSTPRMSRLIYTVLAFWPVGLAATISDRLRTYLPV